jgi:predicted nucleic acid-binding protein
VTLYADSSALVTVYADEAGRVPLDPSTPIVVSQVARVEVPAALWRKQRTGGLEAAMTQELTDEFAADYYGDADTPPRFAVVPVTVSILEQAARLTAVHGLRAYDAIQLSTALTARSVDKDCSLFAAYDEELRRAAAAEGFRLVP